MRALILRAAAHPWLVLALLFGVTLAFIPYLTQLQVHISAEAILKKDTDAWHRYLSAEARFGNEEVAIVVFRDDELLTDDKLAAIRGLLDELDALPFVARTQSLFNVPDIKSVDGYVTTQPFIDTLPLSADDAQRIPAAAHNNPLVRGNLIAADGNTLAINVTLTPANGDAHFEEKVTTTIESLIEPLRTRFDEVFQIGEAAIAMDITERLRHDQTRLLPLSVLVLLVALVVVLRRLSAALIPLCTAALSVVWTLGFLAVMQIPLNIMTSIVPALLVVIGSTEDIHLIAEYATGIREGRQRPAAIERMAEKMGLAILLTFATTYVGFLSIALNDIELLRQFGIAASTGLLFNFVITVLLVPVLLGKLGHRRSHSTPHARRQAVLARLAVGLMLRLRRQQNAVFIGAGLIAVIALVGALELRIDNSLLDYLDADAPLRTHADEVHQTLSGIHTFSIIVDGQIDNTFLQVKYLDALRKMQRIVDDAGVFDLSYSFADFVMLLNTAVDDEPAGELRFPDADDGVRELLLFVKPTDIAGYMTPNYATARILVRHNIASSEQLAREVAALREQFAAQIDPALHVNITGKGILSNEGIADMARGQLQSLLLVGVVIFCLVSVLFVSGRAGLIALIPNLFPVLILFGVMGFAAIPLNTGTSMIAAIALGICVDDTMHVMARFHEELRRRRSRRAALCAMLHAEAEPITATSMALMAGFLVFATSSFQPVEYFGLLSALVILIALLATFVLTPLLLGKAELLTVWDILSCDIQDNALRQSPLFAGMYVWQIKKLVLASEVRKLAAGERIIEEGTIGREIYLMLDGTVEACKRKSDGTVDRLRRMGVGELFGEVAPLSGCKRTADVVAVAPTRVLVLSWRRIERLTHIYPILAFRLFRNLTRIIGARLTQTTEYKGERETETSGPG